MVGRRIVLGMGVVVALVAWCCWNVDRRQVQQVASDILQYPVDVPLVVTLEDEESIRPSVKTPVFRKEEEDYLFIGTVESLADSPLQVRLSLERSLGERSFGEQVLGQGAIEGAWEYYETPDSMAWVAQTLFPEDKRIRLYQELRQRIEQRSPRLMRELELWILSIVSDVVPQFQLRLRESIEKHRDSLEELGVKYQESLVDEKLIPLLKSEVLPIVEQKASPLGRKIGAELFERASVWRFTWRYLYDVSPLPQRDLVQREFERFLKREGIPVLESHASDILQVVEDIIVETSANAQVRQTTRQAMSELFHDPELRETLVAILKDVIGDGAWIQQSMQKHWESDAGQRVARVLEEIIDPWLHEVGVSIFGTNEGLTPEFVAVLRSQVLMKDRAWIVWNPSASANGNASAFGKHRLQRGKGLPIHPQSLQGQQGMLRQSEATR